MMNSILKSWYQIFAVLTLHIKLIPLYGVWWIYRRYVNPDVRPFWGVWCVTIGRVMWYLVWIVFVVVIIGYLASGGT